ncbi:MAG: lipoyl synthase [Candidatus Hodarchaeota archaeon]
MKGKAKPNWIRTKLPTKEQFKEVRKVLGEKGLHTVCEEAFCPNCTECWESGTATFLLMGDVCTRGCKFCDVKTGNPRRFIDPDEPNNLANAVKNLKLKYVVLTSVDRDDLDDGGAEHLASCIKRVKQLTPDVIIEILIPDFQGSLEALQKVIEAKPDVIGHNIETTEVLTPMVRDKRASFKQSISVLKNIKKFNPKILTKSSIMLGLGETNHQVLEALHTLRQANVDIVTLGQYLQPSRKNLAVVEYIEPHKFEYWKKIVLKMGFLYVASGPLVRSSYRAGELYIKNFLKNQQQYI